MKRIWVPFLVLLLLPASYSVQRLAGRPETTHPTHEDSIRSQTQEAGETILYFPDYVDGGGWSVQLALSRRSRTRPPRPWLKSTTNLVGRSWICSIRDRLSDCSTAGQPGVEKLGHGRRGWIQVRTASVSGLLTYQGTGDRGERGTGRLDRFAPWRSRATSAPEWRSQAGGCVQSSEATKSKGAFVSRGNFHQSALTLPEWFDARPG